MSLLDQLRARKWPQANTGVPAKAGINLQTIEGKFYQFHAQNPHVYERLRQLALDLKNRGRKKYGIAGLFEVLRWEHAMSTTDEDFKLNNNYRAYYARLLMENEPELDGFFATRVQTSRVD